MSAKRTWLLRVLLPGLCVAAVACGGSGAEVVRVDPTTVPPLPTEPVATLVVELPTVVLTPEETPAQPVDTATEPVDVIPSPTEPSPDEEILDDLAQELFVSLGGAGSIYCYEVPAGPLPAVTGDVWESHSGWICLWGFPAGGSVSVELHDPSGRLVAAREFAVDDEEEGVGLVEILVAFAGRPAGSWTIVANSAGASLEAPFHVAKPDGPAISIRPAGADLFAGHGPQEWLQIPYAAGEQLAVFGAGFPPDRRLPLGIYYLWGTGAQARAELLHGLVVQADGQGRFEVHLPLEDVALLGEGMYSAVVPLDPSYQAWTDGSDPRRALDYLVVSSAGAHAGDVILALAYGGGFLEDPTVQQAVLPALNRLHLSDHFDGAPVTFLFAIQGNEPVDVTAEPWDPNLARQLLASAGYAEDATAEFVYPEGDPELDELAVSFADNLTSIGLEVQLVPVSSADLDRYVGNKLAAPEPVLWLVRR